VVASEQEAILIRGLLETAGIQAEHRVMQLGENFGGSYEVIVRDEDLEAAREVLPQEE
jgi:Putative prokaryotic signal transducing protein